MMNEIHDAAFSPVLIEHVQMGLVEAAKAQAWGTGGRGCLPVVEADNGLIGNSANPHQGMPYAVFLGDPPCSDLRRYCSHHIKTCPVHHLGNRKFWDMSGFLRSMFLLVQNRALHSILMSPLFI